MISVKRQKDVIILIPYKSTDINEGVAKLLLGKDIDTYVKRTQKYHQSKGGNYSVALGQCTDAMNNHLKG